LPLQIGKFFEKWPDSHEAHSTGSTEGPHCDFLIGEVATVGKNLLYLMKECHRLYLAQDMFPPVYSKDKEDFFSNVFKTFTGFRSAVKEMSITSLQNRRHNKMAKALVLKALGPEVARLSSLGVRYSSRPLEDQPTWHPRKCADKTWNEWLKNLKVNEYQHPGEQNRIHHQLPEMGMRIHHRTKYMYETVEQSYMLVSTFNWRKPFDTVADLLQGNRVIREQPIVSFQLRII
jgi:hypothetical protein